MEDPSITKRLIDFGIDEHEYDEVQDLPETSDNQQQQQQQSNNSNCNNTITTATTPTVATTITIPETVEEELPPELPPPKQKSTKNSKTAKNKGKSKSKIPRSPAALSNTAGSFSQPHSNNNNSGNNNNSNSNTNNNKDSSSGGSGNRNSTSSFYLQQPQPTAATTTTTSPSPSVPPQTPPLPVNYQQQQQQQQQFNSCSNSTSSSSNNNNTTTSNNNNVNTVVVVGSEIMGGGVQLSGNGIGGSTGGSTGVISGGGGGGVGDVGVSIGGGGGGGGGVGGNTGIINGANSHRSSSVNMAASRRSQIQILPIGESPKHFQYLTLTVRKNENGYGMKVSGDNPVFVESVKPGGAAQIAGLVAGDMILKVNGQEVRSEKHPTVVSLIKASTIVELAVKRSHKMARPSSVGIVPTTPNLSGRDRTTSITGPQPVDSIKRREMETYKIQTLQMMIEQEKLNLERLKGEPTNPSYILSEGNIRKLKEQLRQVGVEDAPTIKCQPTSNNKGLAMLSPTQIQHLSASSQHQHHLHHYQQQQQQHHLHNPHHNIHHQATTPQPPPTQSSPAFLSLLPRSLSSLSLGTRKNKIDKDLITSPLNNTTDFLHTSIANTTIMSSMSPTPTFNMSQSLHQTSQQQQQLLRNSTPLQQQQLYYQQQQQQQRYKDTPKSSTSSSSNSKSKSKFAAQAKNLIEEDIPPPLPQRNPPRGQQQLPGELNNSQFFSPISDLDQQQQLQSQQQQQRQSPQTPSTPTSSMAASQKKRSSKTKTKALSDPKMSTQMFLHMETSSTTTTHGGAGNGGGYGIDGVSELDCVPPPLPPRQPGMLEEASSVVTVHKGSFQNLHTATSAGARPPPNSIATLLTYPLVSTCTPVHRDNMAAAFPFSQRPNIVQQLQQHQQQQQQQQLQHDSGCGQTAVLGQTPQHINHLNKHRRVVSTPDSIHIRHPDRLNKTTSGSWDLVEKDGEVTPPGTPPPPYLTAHANSMSDEQQQQQALDSSHGMVSPTGSGAIFIESHQFTPLPSSGGGGATSPSGLAAAHSSRIQAAQASAIQKEIISMEDEDASDQESPFIDENGPFNHFQRLLEQENAAYLAVFLNYVLSNSEPAPLLFYLITGLYKEGSAKDMRKWAYEIHSTFLVPRAPLAWYRQDESLAREVDNVLQSEFDKVEILRKVFWKSRKRAREIICEQLHEFQQKRTAGLGTIYGPTDAQLIDTKKDKDKHREQQIFEETLLVKLQALIEEYERDLPVEDAHKLALCSALSTVIHRIFITRPNSIVDRVHHFVSREKSFKSRIMGKNRKMIVRGHQLVLRQYYEVTHCNHCQTIIWGVSPQGYHCTDCKLNIHRSCSKVLDENCPGPVPQSKRKEPHNDNKISKFMDKIRPRTSSDFIQMEKRARHEEDMDATDLNNERLNSTSIVRQPSDRRPDGAGNTSFRANGSAAAQNKNDLLQTSYHGGSVGGGNARDADAGTMGTSASPLANLTPQSNGGDMTAYLRGVVGDATPLDAAMEGKDVRRECLQQQHQQYKSAPVSVNRSESYKERLSHKRNRNSRRKTSDPSLASRPPNDDQGDAVLSNSNYTASSNSSLSSGGGSESPSTSMEQMGSAATVAASHAHPSSMHGSVHHAGMPHHAHQHSHQDSFHSVGSGTGSGSTNLGFWGGSLGGGGPQLIRQWNFESEDEDDLNEVDWSSNVAAEMLSALTDGEKKRQEIINEIYQTERSHVRTLKLLERLFFVPLQESSLLSQDHLLLLFPPSLVSLRELHGAFEQKLKQRRLEHNHVVLHVGDLLAGMFDGDSGDVLREFAAQFCARQQIALEALKEKRRKDEQLQKILTKAESHKACRRLQLKDLLPTVLQRLTKYPLLFENLYKVTKRVVPENTTEADAIQRALESSKKILVDVNQAVKTAEDAHKLLNIQRKLDKSTFDKDEFKNLDLTQYRLIHDGSLTMKKNPSIQLHGLLFENMIVLLTKQDDKYSLKYLHATRNAEVNNKPVSPIMSIDSETLVRQEAADKNSFFLIKTKTSQMLELRAPSSSECKTWFKHISDAAEQYKPRSKNANHEPVDDPAIATLPHSNTKESLELAPERPPPISATATVTTTPLAPMMPPPTVTTAATYANNNNNNDGVLMRNGRRESTPVGGVDIGGAIGKQRLSHNELSPNIAASAVNRSMSTRSCGEPMNNNNNYNNVDSGVTLRHTQSARQASGAQQNDNGDGIGQNAANAVAGSKRDSASIVYSNNSNNTRTLMQSSPPLVEPTAIQISISPAHTAEPVLTPAERLRRLDASIRDGLLEKQKIICDMFRLPVEHFNEIVDIAAMPEAPKDSADIALAAYAQVQSLTEVLNDYMHVTPEQEISAVSTAVCDQCFEKQQRREQQQQRPLTPLALSTNTNNNSSSSCTSSATSISAATQIAATITADDVPPPLPPPNKPQPRDSQKQSAQPQTPSAGAVPTVAAKLEQADIHEDDDGYCEIDELRLPALPPLTLTGVAAASANAQKQKSTPDATSPPPLPPPAGSFKTPPPPPPPPATSAKSEPPQATPELVKRQSTISADSIPEESADEVTQALDDDGPTPPNPVEDSPESNNNAESNEQPTQATENSENEQQIAKHEGSTTTTETATENADGTAAAGTPTATEAASLNEQQSELNAALNTLSTLNKLNTALSMVDDSTQTLPLPMLLAGLSMTAGDGTKTNAVVGADGISSGNSTLTTFCGPNRIQHASSLEPSVPCHALNSIVSALNAQISLLLPKINERDMERERLRKENQHLRELLNAWHDRQRVDAKLETPVDTTSSAAAATTATNASPLANDNNELNGDTDSTTTTIAKNTTIDEQTTTTTTAN